MGLSQYLDSAERHLAKLKAGMRDEPHATMLLWNVIGYIFTGWMVMAGLRPSELNDMPDHTSGELGAIAAPLSPYEVKALNGFFGTNVAEGWLPENDSQK